MDAMEFLSEAKRICDQHTEPCNTCAANEFCGFTPEFPSDFGETTQMQKMVELVETWSKEHPHKTRQSVFLEQYPEAQIDDNGVLSACNEPCPMADMAHEAAKGRMYATREFIALQKKIEDGQLVEVVRCKDCENSYYVVDGLICSYGPCLECHVPPEFWCAYGERREDAHAQD